MKTDERQLLELSQQITKQNIGYISFRGFADLLDIPLKRAAYILQKWTDKGWYDYGVSVMYGWLTPEGLEIDSGLNKGEN